MSGAYYAMFHAAALTCAKLLIGTSPFDRASAEWRQVYRSLDYGYAKEQCKRLPATFTQDVRGFADTFVVLQESRHAADYDPNAAFLLGDVESYIILAESALGMLASAAKRDQRAFAVWILLKTRK